ncbi:MAG: DUF4266 domain-containing protein [Oceanococcus sp.]
MHTSTHRVRNAALLLISVSLLSACASLEPWQRGKLAQAGMAFNDDPLTSAYQSHVEFSKEAVSGDAGLAGSGCGCN